MYFSLRSLDLSLAPISPPAAFIQMLTSPPSGKGAVSLSGTGRQDDNSFDLRFISDLGRSLLFTVHPKKVATRVAEAIRLGVGAETCAFVAELESIGLISCAFGDKGEISTEFLNRARFEKWLAFMRQVLEQHQRLEDMARGKFLRWAGTYQMKQRIVF